MEQKKMVKKENPKPTSAMIEAGAKGTTRSFCFGDWDSSCPLVDLDGDGNFIIGNDSFPDELGKIPPNELPQLIATLQSFLPKK